jgi:hypothetical protein
MAKTITLEVSYGQLAVFASSLIDPFNDWTDRHVAQGFAWRPGSVSFRTIAENAQHSVTVEVVDTLASLDSEAVRVFEVPFEVPSDGVVEIGSVGETVLLNLAPAPYLLRCEFLMPTADGLGHVRLVFARRESSRFAIVRADAAIRADCELLTTAEAARQ